MYQVIQIFRPYHKDFIYLDIFFQCFSVSYIISGHLHDIYFTEPTDLKVDFENEILKHQKWMRTIYFLLSIILSSTRVLVTKRWPWVFCKTNYNL